MTSKVLLVFCIPLLMFAIGCEQESASPSFPPSEGAIQSRVDAARGRLEKTEGGKLLWSAIEAHGGLKRWYTNGPVQFRWDYRMTDRGPDARINTIQMVDTWHSRAVHTWQSKDGQTVKFGWNGAQSWTSPSDAELPVPPDFWSLTPFYFVGVPFVLADPGTNHQNIEPVEFLGQTYEQVKVTYTAGTGETPDDYYIVLIDPKSKLVRGVRYIVTHPKLYPDGPSPEKLLTYDDLKEINGILWPNRHETYPVDKTNNTFGEKMRYAEVSEIKYVDRDDAFFSGP